MNRLQRAIAKAIGIAPATKALTRPAWWGDVWNTNALGEGGVFGNTPGGWRGAVNSNVWAYNSVKARMSLVAQAPLKMYVGDGDERQEIEDHPVLQLLREVNPVNLNARSLMRGIEQQLSIYGRCLVHKNRAIGVKELYILPMEYVEIVPSETEWISGYRWLPTGDVIPRADVIDFFYPAANGSVEADSPAAVALGSINRYNLADRSQAAIDKRGGQKGGLVIHPKDEIVEDYHRTRDEWDRRRADPDSAGRDMHVPFGTGFDGNAFSATEMQREERNQRLAKEIMAAFSVPPAAAGDYRDASVLANAATQMSTLWTLWGVDELKFIAEELTYSLLWAEYPDAKTKGYYFEHDLTGIQALREDADALANRAIVLYQGSVATLNEARQLAGFDAVDDPRADQIQMVDSGQPAQQNTPAIAIAGKAEQHTGVMVALMLSPADAALIEEQLPASWEAEGVAVEPASNYHVTLCYLGDSVNFDATTKANILKNVEYTAQRFTIPAQVTIKGAGRFVNPNGDAIWAGVAADGLANMQSTITQNLRETGVTIPNDHGDYRPHMTLAYVESGKPATVPPIQSIRASFPSLTVMWGGERYDFPMGGNEAYRSVTAKALLPIVDFVGMSAVDGAGNELGIIEKIHRFGTFDGIEATKAVPVVIIAGKAYNAGDVKVVANGGE